jgi:RimJ/RimL family protein N-acetyltransferase
MQEQQAAVAALRSDPTAITPCCVIRDMTGRYIGDFQFMRLSVSDADSDLDANRVWLAYILHPDFHSSGIGTAVVEALLGWGAVHMRATGIEAVRKCAGQVTY